MRQVLLALLLISTVLAIAAPAQQAESVQLSIQQQVNPGGTIKGETITIEGAYVVLSDTLYLNNATLIIKNSTIVSTAPLAIVAENYSRVVIEDSIFKASGGGIQAFGSIVIVNKSLVIGPGYETFGPYETPEPKPEESGLYVWNGTIYIVESAVVRFTFGVVVRQMMSTYINNTLLAENFIGAYAYNAFSKEEAGPSLPEEGGFLPILSSKYPIEIHNSTIRLNYQGVMVVNTTFAYVSANVYSNYYFGLYLQNVADGYWYLYCAGEPLVNGTPTKEDPEQIYVANSGASSVTILDAKQDAVPYMSLIEITGVAGFKGRVPVLTSASQIVAYAFDDEAPTVVLSLNDKTYSGSGDPIASVSISADLPDGKYIAKTANDSTMLYVDNTPPTVSISSKYRQKDVVIVEIDATDVVGAKKVTLHVRIYEGKGWLTTRKGDLLLETDIEATYQEGRWVAQFNPKELTRKDILVVEIQAYAEDYAGHIAYSNTQSFTFKSVAQMAKEEIIKWIIIAILLLLGAPVWIVIIVGVRARR